jgi:hypothetical protein
MNSTSETLLDRTFIEVSPETYARFVELVDSPRAILSARLRHCPQATDQWAARWRNRKSEQPYSTRPAAPLLRPPGLAQLQSSVPTT